MLRRHMQGRKALFAAPLRPLPAQGTVTLRLRRGHAFSPDVTMTTTWLQELCPQPQPGQPALEETKPSGTPETQVSLSSRVLST